MPYATQQDLETRFGAEELEQLSDRDGSAGAIVVAVVAAALADADQLVNGYVGGRYATPLNPVPDLVTRWACDLARYFLHTDGVSDVVKANYEAAVTGLKDVARGTVTLQCAGIEAPEAASATDDFTAVVDGPEAVFTAAAMGDF